MGWRHLSCYMDLTLGSARPCRRLWCSCWQLQLGRQCSSTRCICLECNSYSRLHKTHNPGRYTGQGCTLSMSIRRSCTCHSNRRGNQQDSSRPRSRWNRSWGSRWDSILQRLCTPGSQLGSSTPNYHSTEGTWCCWLGCHIRRRTAAKPTLQVVG